MISREGNPVEWALLSYELEDTIEHLQQLYKNFTTDADISEEEFSIAMGHIYAHLNRIWHLRNHKGEMTPTLFEAFSQFPNDIQLHG